MRETLVYGDKNYEVLYHALVGCEHDVQPQWSGVECVKCGGWFCY